MRLCVAVRRISADCAEGKLKPGEISEEVISGYLDTHGIPDPDLLIRTSGELRLSNYLLWRLHIRILFYRCSVAGFSKAELEKAIEQYNRRDRRYGGVKEEQKKDV